MRSITSGFKALLLSQLLSSISESFFLVMAVFEVSENSMAVFFVAAAYIFPACLAFLPAGLLSDCLNKRNLIVALKGVEAGLMLLAIVGGYFDFYITLLVLFMVRIKNGFVFPAIYGATAELVEEKDIVYGNGMLHFCNNIGLVLGSSAAGYMFYSFGSKSLLFLGVPFFVSIIGLIFSLFIENLQPAYAGYGMTPGLIDELKGGIREIFSSRTVGVSVLLLVTLGFIFSFLQEDIMVYSEEKMMMGNTAIGLLISTIFGGMAFGGLFAGKFKTRPEPAGVPVGAVLIIISLFSGGVWFKSLLLFFLSLFSAGFGSGILFVKLYSTIHKSLSVRFMGMVFSLIYLFSFIAVLLASSIVWLGNVAGNTSGDLLFLLAKISCAIFFILFIISPYYSTGFLFWLSNKMKTYYSGKIPEEKFVFWVNGSNGSRLDFFLLSGVINGPVKFLIQGVNETLFDKLLGNIVRFSDDADFKVKLSELYNGKDVLFIMGSSKNVQLKCNLFQEYPVVPVYLDHDYEGRSFILKLLSVPAGVGLSFGRRLLANEGSIAMSRELNITRAEAFGLRVNDFDCLHILFWKKMKSMLSAFCMADSEAIVLSYAEVFARSWIISQRLDEIIGIDGKRVGVALKPTVNSALVNIALSIHGSVSANINFDDTEMIESIIERQGVEYIITSKDCIRKSSKKIIYIEDLADKFDFASVWSVYLKSFLLPSILAKFLLFKRNDNLEVTIIQTMENTGFPEGAVLTHKNILANIKGLNDQIRLSETDVIASGESPSGKYGVGLLLWMPLLLGAGVVYQENATEKTADFFKSAGIAGTTILVGSAQMFKKAFEEDLKFAYLRLAISVTGRIGKAVANGFRESLGVEPLEYYGVAEMGSAVSCNKKCVNDEGLNSNRDFWPHSGVAVKVVHPDTYKEIKTFEYGVLLVKGAGLTKCYADNPELSKNMFDEGWFSTGEIVALQENGAMIIANESFSMIENLIIPHLILENILNDKLGDFKRKEYVCAVNPEALMENVMGVALLFSLQVEENNIRNIIKKSGLIPQSLDSYHIDIFNVESIPLTFDGEIDHDEVSRIVELKMEEKNIFNQGE